MGIEKSSLGIVLGVGVGVIALSNNVSAESIDSKMKLEETRIKYTKENLNLRTQPSLNAVRITTVKKGTKLEVISISGVWAKVKYNGTVAYCHNGYLIDNSSSLVETQYTVVTTNILNLRKGPSTASAIIGKLKKGEEVNVVATTGQWLKVNYKGTIGYCNANYTQKKIISNNLNNKVKFNNIVAVHTTTYKIDGSRSKNIEKAANAINNRIVKPGGWFSFNSCAAPYNQANGYYKAPIFVGNGIKYGYGGGVCQVSTTLFNACLKAGIIPKYQNHSSKVAYADYGLDATVTDYRDFIFKNNFREDLKIKTTITKNGPIGVIKTYITSENALLDGKTFTPKVKKIRDKVYETELWVLKNGKLEDIKKVGVSTYLK